MMEGYEEMWGMGALGLFWIRIRLFVVLFTSQCKTFPPLNRAPGCPAGKGGQ